MAEKDFLSTKERQIMKEVSRETVRETFLQLGVDTSKPEAVKDMQRDFAWLRSTREGSQNAGKWVRRTAVSTLVGAFLYIVWLGLKSKVMG